MDVATLVPSIAWLSGYRRDWLGADLVAGLTTAAVVIPKAMAYATIAGLPLEVGLYTAFVPMAVYALLGTSRPLSVSTTTTIAILSAAAIAEGAPGAGPAQALAAGAALAVLVGAILVAASVLQLGFVANFISEPVLVGFKSGIGLVIVVDQLPKVLGLHIHKAGFLRDLLAVVEHLPDASLVAFAVSASLFVLLMGLEHFAPRSPAPLVGIGLAIAATTLLGLDRHGLEVVGAVPRGLPVATWPRADLLQALWPAATGIALMSFTETIAAARAFRSRGEPMPSPNQELLALGVANLGGGLLGAMPAGGGTSQTSVNRRAGARTQLSGLVTAAATMATLLLLAPLFAKMPHAALAVVVIVYSLDLVQPEDFRAIRRVRSVEFRWALIALAGVVALGTLRGILVAVIASLLSLAHQSWNPPVYVLGRKRGSPGVFRPLSAEHPDDETWPGLLVLRTEGRVFFANGQRIGERMMALIEEASPRVVLLDCSAIVDIEYTALRALAEAEERLAHDGVTLWMAALNPEVLEVVRQSRLGEVLGRDRMFFNVETAVARWQQARQGE